MSGDIGKWIVLMGYTAILFVLVRPGSQGPSFVENVGTGVSSVINASTGGSGWPNA